MRVFLSYARLDGKDLALRLQEDLTRAGHDVWLDTARLHSGSAWTSEIEQAIDHAELVLALLTPGSFASQICRAEQLRSQRKGKTVMPVLARPGADIPLYLEAETYLDFTVGDYSAQLDLLLEDIRTGRHAAPLPEKFRTTVVTAPPLPRNYIERPGALLPLRNALITDDPGPSVALTALRGMGGIGKTILAQALAHDEVIQQAFPDGVVWATAGQNPAYDLVTRMREVRRALGDTPAEKETELESINRYRALLRGKAALVIVDDVWHASEIGPFLAESSRSRILFTTRDASIAAAVGAREQIADLLTEPESRILLARWSGRELGDLPPEAADLIRECGRLPLAISMIGAMLRGKPAEFWPHTLQLLLRADLAKIRAHFPNYPHADLLRAIQVSVDALDDFARRRYLSLAVLLEDMAVPPAIQQALWNADEMEALETAEQFLALSLARREGPAIRLHNLQFVYVRSRYAGREALDLIQGAVRLSWNVIDKDPQQFRSQIVGRLLPHSAIPAIAEFTRSIGPQGRPWFRPLWPVLHPPGTSLVRTLEGHSLAVRGVALTSDGRRAVSASADWTLKVWDLESGRTLQTLDARSERINAVALTPDGRRAVSAHRDKTLKVWDLESGRLLRILEGHLDWVLGLAISPDGRRVVSASDDKTLKVWDLESGRERRTLEGHSQAVLAVAFCHDAARAVSASSDRTLKVWELETGRALLTLEGHSDWVFGVSVTPDGRVVSASSDKTLKVWDLQSGRALATWEGHSGPVYAVAILSNGRQAVSASEDKTLKLWDLENGRPLCTFEGHSAAVRALALSQDGRLAVSASADTTVKVWQLEAGRPLRPPQTHAGSVFAVAASADGRLAVSASRDRTLKVWDLENGRALRTLEGHPSLVNAVALSADGRRAISASQDWPMKLWDVETGQPILSFEGPFSWVNAVQMTPDGKRAVSGHLDKTLKLWDLETGRLLRTLSGHASQLYALALTLDGRQAVSASGDNTLRLWDLETGNTLRVLEGHFAAVHGVALAPDCRRALSASWDQTLKLWDLESGRAIQTLRGHAAPVDAVAVSPAGRHLISASGDTTLKLWDLETAAPLAEFTCDTPPLCCAFAGPNRILAGDEAGRLHFLSLEL